MSAAPIEIVQRLARATNDHDLEGIVGCFSEDYVNETPSHPGRGFRGRAQVRRNWAQILHGVPDLSARVLAVAVDGEMVWSEWVMSGTRRDGAAHEMRGVVIFVVAGGSLCSARFYLEPVEHASGTVDEAVRAAVTAPAAADPA